MLALPHDQRWTPSTFNHASVFPLTGAHATLACAQCHTNNNYTHAAHDLLRLPPDGLDWDNEPEPRRCRVPHHLRHMPHHDRLDQRQLQSRAVCQLSTDRSACDADLHSVPHEQQLLTTRQLPATPATRRISTAPRIRITSLQVSRRIARSATRRPRWSPSSFNHNNTAFPLTGAHTTVACTQCHTNNNYTTLPTTCYGCHQADWNGTTDPNHAAAGFPTTCDTCHTTTDVDWRDIQSQQHAVPAHRRAHYGGLRQMPYQQRFCRNADGVLFLPRCRLYRDDESQSRHGWLAHHLHHVSHNDSVGSRDTASELPHFLPAESRQSKRRVCYLPHQLI